MCNTNFVSLCHSHTHRILTHTKAIHTLTLTHTPTHTHTQTHTQRPYTHTHTHTHTGTHTHSHTHTHATQAKLQVKKVTSIDLSSQVWTYSHPANHSWIKRGEVQTTVIKMWSMHFICSMQR